MSFSPLITWGANRDPFSMGEGSAGNLYGPLPPASRVGEDALILKIVLDSSLDLSPEFVLQANCQNNWVWSWYLSANTVSLPVLLLQCRNITAWISSTSLQTKWQKHLPVHKMRDAIFFRGNAQHSVDSYTWFVSSDRVSTEHWTACKICWENRVRNEKCWLSL